MYPSWKAPRASRTFHYKCCFIVDVDGKKLPNKLDLFAFRKGKNITPNEESDKEDEDDDENVDDTLVEQETNDKKVVNSLQNNKDDADGKHDEYLNQFNDDDDDDENDGNTVMGQNKYKNNNHKNSDIELEEDEEESIQQNMYQQRQYSQQSQVPYVQEDESVMPMPKNGNKGSNEERNSDKINASNAMDNHEEEKSSEPIETNNDGDEEENDENDSEEEEEDGVHKETRKQKAVRNLGYLKRTGKYLYHVTGRWYSIKIMEYSKTEQLHTV